MSEKVKNAFLAKSSESQWVKMEILQTLFYNIIFMDKYLPGPYGSLHILGTSYPSYKSHDFTGCRLFIISHATKYYTCTDINNFNYIMSSILQAETILLTQLYFFYEA